MPQTPVPFSSSFRSLTLNVTTGTSQNQVTHTQPITSVFQGNNSVPITDAGILTAFNSQAMGTSFTPSIDAKYGSDGNGNALTTISTPSVASFIPKVISLGNIPNKLTTDAPFSLSSLSLINTVSTGVLSYSSSNTSVATVNSLGQVTPVGAGTTTITVTQAATANHPAASASRTFTVIQFINTFIDNSSYVAPFNNSNWQSYTTANYLPNFTMAARAAPNSVQIGAINGVPTMARRLQLTVHLPKGLGLDGGRWVIQYKFERKVNGTWDNNAMLYSLGYNLGYENGVLVWLTTTINTEVDPNPYEGVGIVPGTVLRCSAAYRYNYGGPYSLDQPHQIKYSQEFTYGN